MNEEVGLLAGRVALELVNSLLPDELPASSGLDRIYEARGEFDFERRLDALKRWCAAQLRPDHPGRWSTRRSGAASR
jgi:hypothetical protein